jgi:hypothetical protein
MLTRESVRFRTEHAGIEGSWRPPVTPSRRIPRIVPIDFCVMTLSAQAVREATRVAPVAALQGMWMEHVVQPVEQ